MTNVHGIAVAGGTFPAEIWHDFMWRTSTGLPYRDFAEPRSEPVWQDDYRGQYQYDGYYDPYGSSSSSEEETTTSTTTTTPAAPQEQQRTPAPRPRTTPQRTTPAATTPATPPPAPPPPRREPPPTD